MNSPRYIAKFVIPCSEKHAQIAVLALDLMMSWEAPTKASIFNNEETDIGSVNSFIKHCINIRIEKLFPPDFSVSSIDPTTSKIWHLEFNWSLHRDGLLIESDSYNPHDLFHIIEAVYSYPSFDINTPIAFDLVTVGDQIHTHTYEYLDTLWICGDTSSVQEAAKTKLANPTRYMLCSTHFTDAHGLSEERLNLVTFPEPSNSADILTTALKESFCLNDQQDLSIEKAGSKLQITTNAGERYALSDFRSLELAQFEALELLSKFNDSIFSSSINESTTAA